jgi:hypothetical protein
VTHRIRCGDDVIENPWFGAPVEEIDRVFAADPKRPTNADLTFAALRERSERVGWVSRPALVEEDWTPNQSNPKSD